MLLLLWKTASHVETDDDDDDANEQDGVIRSHRVYAWISSAFCLWAEFFHGYTVKGAEHVPKTGAIFAI